MSTALYNLIARAAAAQPLTIAQYMELALQHPEHGYYRRHDPLGARGDFITAPEISQMFGELIGLWCVDMWGKLGRPNPFTLCELGPGRGTLLRDAFRAAHIVPEFSQSCRLVLLESNADLRATQAESLARYTPQWLDGLDDLPPQPTIIIANEFFDALPIRQFIRRAGAWYENCVGCVENQLRWVALPALLPRAENISAVSDGTVIEVSPASVSIMQPLSRHITHCGGAMLAIDYGYEIPPGSPTFQALSRHAFTDPLQEPGLADLTAHVDFDALATMAQAQGARVWSLLSQGDFLRALGIDQRCAQLAIKATSAQRDVLMAAHRRLTDSAGMGSLFKVLGVTSARCSAPAGWE